MFLFTPTVLVVIDQFHELTGAMLHVELLLKTAFMSNSRTFINQKLQTNCPKVKSTSDGMHDICLKKTKPKKKPNHV